MISLVNLLVNLFSWCLCIFIANFEQFLHSFGVFIVKLQYLKLILQYILLTMDIIVPDGFVFEARFLIPSFSPIAHFFLLGWLKMNQSNKIS